MLQNRKILILDNFILNEIFAYFKIINLIPIIKYILCNKINLLKLRSDCNFVIHSNSYILINVL
jgi:hypothetical protein